MHPAITSHAITVLPDMSLPGRDTPRPFQPPVAQRDLKAEVIYCVGGVTTAVLVNVTHGRWGFIWLLLPVLLIARRLSWHPCASRRCGHEN